MVNSPEEIAEPTKDLEINQDQVDEYRERLGQGVIINHKILKWFLSQNQIPTLAFVRLENEILVSTASAAHEYLLQLLISQSTRDRYPEGGEDNYDGGYLHRDTNANGQNLVIVDGMSLSANSQNGSATFLRPEARQKTLNLIESFAGDLGLNKLAIDRRNAQEMSRYGVSI